MQQIVKEVAELTIQSEKQIWQTLENNIIKNFNQMTVNDFATLVHHFGFYNQGSKQLWQQFESKVPQYFPKMDIDQASETILGFGFIWDQYKVNDKLSKQFTQAWLRIGDEIHQQEMDQDPYYARQHLNWIKMVLPSKFGPQVPQPQTQNQTVNFSQDYPLVDYCENYKIIELSDAEKEYFQEEIAVIKKEVELFGVELSDYIKYK